MCSVTARAVIFAQLVELVYTIQGFGAWWELVDTKCDNLFCMHLLKKNYFVCVSYICLCGKAGNLTLLFLTSVSFRILNKGRPIKWFFMSVLWDQSMYLYHWRAQMGCRYWRLLTLCEHHLNVFCNERFLFDQEFVFFMLSFFAEILMFQTGQRPRFYWKPKEQILIQGFSWQHPGKV
jgi:hypothetical protein